MIRHQVKFSQVTPLVYSSKQYMKVTPLTGPACRRVMDWRCGREGDQRWGSFARMGQRRPRANPRPPRGPAAAGPSPDLLLKLLHCHFCCCWMVGSS